MPQLPILGAVGRLRLIMSHYRLVRPNESCSTSLPYFELTATSGRVAAMVASCRLVSAWHLTEKRALKRALVTVETVSAPLPPSQYFPLEEFAHTSEAVEMLFFED